MMMRTRSPKLRPATDADRPAVLAMLLAEEVSWFGEAENTEDEIGEFLDHAGGGVPGGVVDVSSDGTVRGFASVGPMGEGWLVIDPADPDPPYAALASWLLEHGGNVIFTYGEDNPRHAALKAAGWRPAFSAFDLARPGTDPVDEARWPEGITVAPFDRGHDAARVHQLIYVDAQWASVHGHIDRPFDVWQGMYGADNRGWVARRADRPVGVALGRIYADGRAVVQQIAVAADERRSGIGRALLLHAYTELLAAGAQSLALGVQAANAGALQLYESIGLVITREWRIFEPAGVTVEP